MKIRVQIALACGILVAAQFAGGGRDLRKELREVRRFREAREAAILREFADFLALPNVADNLPDILRNAEFLKAGLERRGIRARLLTAGDAPPVVFGEWPAPKADRTVIFYAHYDGQPVDPSRWSGDPWKAVLKESAEGGPGIEIPWPAAPSRMNGEWRLQARGASDDKGTIVALLTAIDALKSLGLGPSVNVKFFFEGEEEKGSPNLAAFLDAYRELLRADGLFLCDGPVHQTRRLALGFGARGMVDAEITVYGPDRALHSGHYGNWAPNPAALLADLLARMRDPEGRILIPGFGDDVRPPTRAELEAVDEAPRIDEELRKAFGLAWNEAGGARLEERILLPAMNIRGLRSGNVGPTAQNAIPVEASASLDFRLVPDQRPEKVRRCVEDFLRGMGYTIVAETPDREKRQTIPRLVKLEWGPGYPAGRTPMDGPFAGAAIRAIEEGMGTALVKLPTGGGSIPIYLFQEKLGCPVILLPIANHDNNQHGADENIRLQNLWEGIEIHAALLLGLDGAWRD